jgi:carbamoyltransferase
MTIWGMSKNGHDWSVAIFKDNNLGNRFKLVNTISGKGPRHTLECIEEANKSGKPDLVIWYENPYLKAIRQFLAGQKNPFKRNNVKRYLRDLNINCKWKYVGHHESHAAAFYKSGFKDATVVVFDSIGEFDCTTIWKAENGKLKKLKSSKYPHSLGLFYSAMTDRVGLKPQQDEAKFEELSHSFTPFSLLRTHIEIDIIKKWEPMPKFKINFHRGARGMWWGKGNKEIASATRGIFEQCVTYILRYAREITTSKNLVISGGVAFNKSMPKLVGKTWDNLYIPPNPSDTGSAEGAVLAYLRK